MTTLRMKVACAAVALSLTACQGSGGFGGLGDMNTTETIGTVGGAAGGALLGSQFGSGSGQLATTAIGTLLGAYAGNMLAKNFSGNDRSRAVNAEQQAVVQNETVTWNNPQSGYSGTVQPQGTFRNSAGQLCRQYTHTVNTGNGSDSAQGVACQQANGTWQLQS
ncbi:RT0821/Lpp0805 family surface protein [Azospirillum sp. ST 5-10]|uniref:RT0821/Lpp0805 family surface protein n=1 Tax=unclassified Azospirillum TaxID=2630922 RepID=UPI003F49D421